MLTQSVPTETDHALRERIVLVEIKVRTNNTSNFHDVIDFSGMGRPSIIISGTIFSYEETFNVAELPAYVHSSH